MDSYKGIACPLCNSQFAEDDDIVVCPECGAPHHRHCYNKAGKCAFSESHSPDFQWDDDRQSAETNNSENERKICSYCSSVNSPNAEFCIKCGHSFSDQQTSYQQATASPVSPIYIDPYGGVDPKSKIDGVEVAELACFVGSNSAYYIPRFKAMSESRNPFSVNWSALFFNVYWMAYRKIYLLAIILAVISSLVSAPLELIMNNELVTSVQEQLAAKIAGIPTSVVVVLCGFIVLVHFIAGFLGNYIYMKRCIRKVKKLSQKSDGTERIEYLKTLMLSGNVSTNKIFFFYFAVALLQTLITYIMAMIL